jgi:outer membrane protein insertion porin family
MNFINIIFLRRKVRFLSVILLVTAALMFVSAPASTAELHKTLVLPLKISTLSDNAALTADADAAAAATANLYAFSFLSRGEAENLLDYNGSWPPPHDVLKKISLFKQYDYIALGSLTEIGGQISLDFKLIDLLSSQSSQYYVTNNGTLAELELLNKKSFSKIAAYTSRESVIASITPAGNKKIDSGAILQHIQTQPGDPYAPADLQKELRSIFAMGYFDDIQIEVNQESDGKAVIFHVTEKPVIKSILFSGIDEIKEETVKEVVTTKEQSILNLMKINKDREAVQQLYKTKGYYNTTVTPDITYPTEESAVVKFVIKEGPKIYIKEISFEGNQTFDDDDLEDEIETDTKGWFSWLTESGLLDYDKLNQDAGRILNFYGNNGFLEAKIGDPVVKQEGKWLFITFEIEEGPRFKVGKVDIQGDLIQDKESLLEILDLPEEEYISRSILREDVLKITDVYAEQGYANAIIKPDYKKSADNTTIDITIDIEKGELVYINRITIKGNDRTRDNVIRRELKVEEGGIFNAKALRESVQKLQYLEFFEEVGITPEQSFDTSTVDLSVDVKEKSTGMFTVGVGYSSVEDLILMGTIAENNFLGRGDTLSFSANIGGESTRYNLNYKNPRYNDSQLSWGIDLFNTEQSFDDYTKDSIGGAISFGYPVWEKWRGYGSYSFTNTDLTDVADDASYIIRNSQDIHITSAVKFSLLRDTRNRRFGPSSGSRHSLSVRYAGGPLGGDSQFTKLEGFTSWYFSMFWDTVFHFHGAAGQVFENEDGGLPVYERFYLGGLRSIRGFESSKISPIENGDRIGGDKMWYSNLEFIFPLLTDAGVNGVVFFDLGNVINDDEDWNFDDYKKSVGAGIRWFSPMGPLRLEWGYNLDPQDDEDQAVWDFSVGGTF